MNAPKSWLNQFVNLVGISNKDFAEKMTFAGNKVEAIHQIGPETVFEFEITSNRPDTLSVIGLAREVSAVFGLPLKLPPIPKFELEGKPPRALKLPDPKLIPAYSLVEISQVTIKPSSLPIAQKLQLIGLKPINNVVDITNYLMYETGQPMHAFDLDQINGSLTLRAAKQGETITPLDHQVRRLLGGEIIIEDASKLIDLAGLMGGLNTEITAKTKNVLLIVPIYDPVSIRRASNSTHIRTEASTRFEKKLDLTQTLSVTSRALTLIKAESGGKLNSSIKTFSPPWVPPTITLTEVDVHKRVGYPIPQTTIDNHLGSIGVTKSPHGYHPPSWRLDLLKPVDLIEEVSRLYGYNRLKKTLPSGEIPIYQDALKPNWPRLIGIDLASLGYTETYASTLISRDLIESIGLNPTTHLKVLHPMSQDFEYMRANLLETLIPFIKTNLPNAPQVNLFEIGLTFHESSDPNNLPVQPLELGAISNTKNFAMVKGDLEYLSNKYQVNLNFQPTLNKISYLYPHQTIQLLSPKGPVGLVGLLHPNLLPIEAAPVYVFSLNLTAFFAQASFGQVYPKTSDQPQLFEDYTFTLPPHTFIGPVITTIQTTHKYIESVKLTTQYHQNYTFTLVYRHPNRSLKDSEIAPIRKTLVEVMAKNFQAKLVGTLD